MSNNFNNPLKFTSYNSGPLSLERVMEIYKEYNIIPVRVEMYYDFVESLCELIFTTYLGDDVTEQKDREKHFEWCWDKTIDTFFSMGFDLSGMGDKYNYFRNFFVDVYYNYEPKSKELEKDILLVWEYIFNYHIIKPEKDVYNFIDVYKMFDNTNWFKK